MDENAPPTSRNNFKIAIICALPLEAEGVRAVFDKCWEDEGHRYGKAVGDKNTYTTGVISRYNVVLVLLPSMGGVPAARAAASLSTSFPKIELVLIVGICGVIPNHPETGEEIVLGDVVISTDVVQYDLGRIYPGGFERKTAITDTLRKAPEEIQGFLKNLGMRQNRQRLTGDLTKLVNSDEFLQQHPAVAYPGTSLDRLYEASYLHQHRQTIADGNCPESAADSPCFCDCSRAGCEEEQLLLRKRHTLAQQADKEMHLKSCPTIHLGRFGSANTVMKSGLDRDRLAAAESLTAFEMEGAGVWDRHPTIVIKGACNYADCHKNKVWQPYAAMTAAACLKVLLRKWVLADELLDEDKITKGRHFGLCLAYAPLIRTNEFIGRTAEIDAIHEILKPPGPQRAQRRAILGGLGGIGKTQIAIAYAQRHEQNYKTVLWLNATSEATLHASVGSVVQQLIAATELQQLDKQQALARLHEWLSQSYNTEWLLIFDNYDEPDLFEIHKFYPNIGHGSIIVTTRLPDLVTGQQVRIQPLQTLEEGLSVLQTRSGRKNVHDDSGAHRLVKRLGGLPLALVTAGAYLRKAALTFQQYLHAYEDRWQINSRRPIQLQEYRDRTLYTTWNLSYIRLLEDDPEAAQMLKVLAYFDHQEVWYELFQGGLEEDSRAFLPISLSNPVDFANLMAILSEYCLVETQHETQSYSMHNCVHDWTLGALNETMDEQLYWYATRCIVGNLDSNDTEFWASVKYARLSLHGIWLSSAHFEQNFQPETVSEACLSNARDVALLLTRQDQFSAAEQLYLRTIAGAENACGPEHILTIETINSLAILYFSQGKLEVAEKKYKSALAITEKVLGPDHRLTLDIVNNLGLLYCNQGRYQKAEDAYQQSLAQQEKILGPDHISTLHTILNLGTLYYEQCRLEHVANPACVKSKLEEAERLFLRALTGLERAIGRDHTTTLLLKNNLGLVYYRQGRHHEAEEMLRCSLVSREKAHGPNHTSTLESVSNLGTIYTALGNLEDAEKMCLRAITGTERALGPKHARNLDALFALGRLYIKQNELEKAEVIYRRAIIRSETTSRSNSTLTCYMMLDLGFICFIQDNPEEAEWILRKAITGLKTTRGADHLRTLGAMSMLGKVHVSQSKFEEAEELFRRVLAGRERALGTDHRLTLYTMVDLGFLYFRQSKFTQAESMYARALTRYETTQILDKKSLAGIKII